jgi:hypothetical protein
MGDRVNGFGVSSKNWRDVAIGGHMELVLDALNSPSKKDHRGELFAGFASVGDVYMLGRLLDVGVVELSEGLLCAIVGRRPEAAKFLLSRGAAATVSDAYRCELQDIIRSGDLGLCQLMKDAGLMVRKDFIRYGAEAGDLSIVDLVPELSADEEFDTFVYLCMYGHAGPINEFLSGSLFRSDDVRRQWASDGLVYASSMAGNGDAVELLLAFNADPNQGMKNACGRGHFNVIQILVDAGATTCECGRLPAEHTAHYSKRRRVDAENAARHAHEAKVRELMRTLDTARAQRDAPLVLPLQ